MNTEYLLDYIFNTLGLDPNDELVVQKLEILGEINKSLSSNPKPSSYMKELKGYIPTYSKGLNDLGWTSNILKIKSKEWLSNNQLGLAMKHGFVPCIFTNKGFVRILSIQKLGEDLIFYLDKDLSEEDSSFESFLNQLMKQLPNLIGTLNRVKEVHCDKGLLKIALFHKGDKPEAPTITTKDVSIQVKPLVVEKDNEDKEEEKVENNNNNGVTKSAIAKFGIKLKTH